LEKPLAEELGAIRDLSGKTFLAGVLFTETYDILRAALIPYAVTRAIVSRNAASFDLITQTIRPRCVNIGMRVSCAAPGKCLAEKVFGEVARWIVRATGDLPCSKFFCHGCMKAKQFFWRKPGYVDCR
jgi:hypothetical protein